jgi:hypothetical protein
MYLQVEHQIDCQTSSTDGLPIISGSSDFTNVGLLQPQILDIMARSHATKYAKWTAKYDKNRDEESEAGDEDDKPEAKRKRRGQIKSSAKREISAQAASKSHSPRNQLRL